MIKDTRLQERQVDLVIFRFVLIIYILLMGTIHKMDWVVISLAVVGCLSLSMAAGYVVNRWINGPPK